MDTLTRERCFANAAHPFSVGRFTPLSRSHPHNHLFSELVIISGGHGWHVTEQEEYALSPGDVFVISGHTWHDYRQLDNLGVINLCYDQDDPALAGLAFNTLPGYHALFTLEPAYRRQHGFRSRLRLSASDLAKVLEWLEQMENELAASRPGAELATVALFTQIVVFLSRCYERAGEPQSVSLLRIGTAISYLQSNYDQPISLDELADMAHMSRRNFQRVFRQAMGRPPMDYLIGLRMQRARQLLQETDMSITAIATRVGFNDSNYFSRQFRKTFGRPPKSLRAG